MVDELFALIAWGAVSGAINLLLSERSRVDAWAAANPRLAAALKLFRAIGLDPWLIVSAISLAVRGKLPAPKPHAGEEDPK